MAAEALRTAVRQIRARLHSGDDTEPTDRDLLRRFVYRHDEAAFTALVKRHQRLVYGALTKLLSDDADIEDAFQATFLVLVRKANSVTWHADLATWLYAVAHRIAVRARSEAQRRRARGDEAARRTGEETMSPDLSWREACQLLHEELDRLPEKLRLPLMLCYLEGKSRDEAAAQMRVSLNTVKGRLELGRNLLRGRLSRRGITLSSGLLAAVAHSTVCASPPRLVDITLSAACGSVAPRVNAVVQQMTATMLLTEFKLGVGLLFLVTLGVLGASVATPSQADLIAASTPIPADESLAFAPEPTTNEKRNPVNDAQDAHTFKGRVVDADNKAIAGAKVYLIARSLKAKGPAVRATTTDDGKFEFVIKRTEVEPATAQTYGAPWWHASLFADAPGHGIGWTHSSQTELAIRLPKPGIAIAGKVIDLEGKPAAGIRVSIQELHLIRPGTPADWRKALEGAKSFHQANRQYLQGVGVGFDDDDLHRLIPTIQTGNDGSFRFENIGEDRVVRLRIDGPEIVTADVFAATRSMETIRLPEFEPRDDLVTFHGASFNHVVAPCQVIEGVVRDKDTGKPIPGAVVTSFKRATSRISGRTDLVAIADKEGRYRLTGMPRAAGNEIQAWPPDDLAYAQQARGVPDPDGAKPATVNFDLKRGVWVTGKVLDKATGKPIQATVQYHAYLDNPNANALRGFATRNLKPSRVDDCSFRIIAVAGQGIVTARASSGTYLHEVGLDKLRQKAERGILRTAPYYVIPSNYHTLVEIDPKPGAGSVEVDIHLDAGVSLKGTILDPEGKPLSGAMLARVKAPPFEDWEPMPLAGAEFTAINLDPAKPRMLLFMHKEKKLAGSVLVRGDEKNAIQVKLEPWGILIGRVLDAEGKPWANGKLRFHRYLPRANPGSADGEQATLPDVEYKTNADGTFRLEGLAPNAEYSLYMYEGERTMIGPLAGERIKLKAGETRQLNARLKISESE